jgi:DNA-binding MarR family transcriptional regulator
MSQTPTDLSLLHHLSTVLSRQADQALQEQLGIGLSQYRIMIAVQANPHIQQRQIASSLSQTEASVSRQIKLLIKSRLIKSTINPSNRRAHITVLTTKGLRFTETAQAVFAKSHQPALGSLNEKQQKAFFEALATIDRHTHKT